MSPENSAAQPPPPPVPATDLDTALAELLQPPRVPRATYRLQLSADLPFAAAQALIPYLDELGVSELYASPIFKPRTGSTHGYDTVDYNQFNPVLGTGEEFAALTDSLRARDMGLLMDIVPNHMGVNTENAWWNDVLKHGPSSEYAHYFDINWRPPNRAMDDKLLLPVLGDHYGLVLEAGALTIVYWHGDFYVHYYEHQFPMTPESYARILALTLEMLPAALDEDEQWVPVELASVVHSLTYLPAYHVTEPGAIITRRREQQIIRWRLLGLFDKSEPFRTALQSALDVINGQPGDSASFDTLDQLLAEQPYRLAYWRVATDEINYRRFFDINDMAAVRVENAQVFADIHRLTLQLMAEGKVSGLRIDHPDGLWDPDAYFWRLQTAYLAAALEQRLGANGVAAEVDPAALVAERLQALRTEQERERALEQSTPATWPFYVLVEKILSESEPLPESWAVHGTTGYDFMSLVNNLLVYAPNEKVFTDLYAAFVDDTTAFDALTDRTKKLVMTQSLTSEIDARSAELAQIVEQNRRYRGFTQNSLAFGLSEFTAALDIYRTYITGPDNVGDRDRVYVDEAIAQAKRRNPLVPTGIFDFLHDTLLMQNFAEFDATNQAELREFVMKFQQITGPVMAKSVEDTAFYIYNRLVSLNEVGGHPSRFGNSVADFHSHNLEQSYPATMLSTSTHDTKRSEDVRARISVLSEMPGEWRTMLDQWALMNADAKTQLKDALLDNQAAPSPNDEYLIYQTLLGAYDPRHDDDETFVARVIAYMHKAINEAKVHSNWINPNDAYAQAISDFVTTIWHDPAFRTSFNAFQQRIAYFGRFNSLAQTLLKLTAPGVPDIYQGTELWDYSLVDPDNRRPVDFERRRALLARLRAAAAEDRMALAAALLHEAESSADPEQADRDPANEFGSGAIKLYLIARTLEYRREHAALFRAGGYVPVAVAGAQAEHVCAFIRRDEKNALLVVVPRFNAVLTKGRRQPPTGARWEDAALVLPTDFADRTLENLLTGEAVVLPGREAGADDEQQAEPRLPVAAALARWPVGLFALR